MFCFLKIYPSKAGVETISEVMVDYLVTQELQVRSFHGKLTFQCRSVATSTKKSLEKTEGNRKGVAKLTKARENDYVELQ